MTTRVILASGKRTVCVVRYRRGDWYNGSSPPANPAVLHQVTLRGDKVSGDLIRLGETVADEISGWQWIDALEVVLVLGVLGEDEKTVTPQERADEGARLFQETCGD